MSDLDLDNLNENDAKYEEIFLGILQKEQKIDNFLECVFKFLYRR